MVGAAEEGSILVVSVMVDNREEEFFLARRNFVFFCGIMELFCAD